MAGLTVNIIRSAMSKLRPVVEDPYLIVIGPSQFRDLVAYNARMKWKDEWRRQRLARRGVIEPPMYGELGTFCGIRWVG